MSASSKYLGVQFFEVFSMAFMKRPQLMIPTHLLANKGKHCKNPSWALPAAGPASCNGEMVLAPRVLNNILLLVCYSLLTSFLLLFALALGVVSEDSEATYTSPTMNWSSTAAKDFCLRHIQGDRLTFPCHPQNKQLYTFNFSQGTQISSLVANL